MKHTSASGAESLVMCPASVVLPQHDSYGGEARDKGNAGHGLLAAVVNKRPGAMAKLTERFPSLGFKLAEKIPACEIATAEAAYVVDLERRTSVYLGTEIERKYTEKLGRPLRPFEMGVSLDFHGVRPGVHVIRDWKFGLYSSWWQLYVQAMATLWAPGQTGALEADAGFVHIIEGQDDEEDAAGETYVFDDTATLYLADLDDRADEIVSAIKSAMAMESEVAAGRPLDTLPTREGKWCDYCGAYPHCPSKQKLVRALGDLDVSNMVTTMTPAQCGAAYKKLVEVEKNIVRKVKKVLKHRLEIEGEFPLDGGKRLRLVTMPGRDSLDRPAMMGLLRTKGATPQEIASCFKTGAPYDMIKETK